MIDTSDFDCCECGDYRHNHKNGTGACCFNDHRQNGGITHGYQKCLKFHLHRRADMSDPNVRRLVKRTIQSAETEPHK